MSSLVCVVCERREYQVPQVCDRDRADLDTLIANVGTLAHALDPHQKPRALLEPVTGGAVHPPLPLSEDALDLAAPNRPATLTLNARGILGIDPDQTGHLSVDTILSRIGREWDTYRGDHPERSYWSSDLATRADWACNWYPEIADNIKELRALERTLRSITMIDRDDTTRIGHCPGTRTQPCGTELRATPWQDSIQCPRCERRWPRLTWLTLRNST